MIQELDFWRIGSGTTLDQRMYATATIPMADSTPELVLRSMNYKTSGSDNIEWNGVRSRKDLIVSPSPCSLDFHAQVDPDPSRN